MTQYVLTLACPDRPGIVAAVSGVLAERDCNIVESQQYGDRGTGRFFMRTQFDAPQGLGNALTEAFAELAPEFALDWHLHDRAGPTRGLILVSKYGHCLNDLLYRHRSGLLGIDVVAVASNHPDMRPLTQSYGINYHHLPVGAQNRTAQEAEILALVEHNQADHNEHTRYMQVLSDDLCAKLPGRIMNIHHSFLPSFKGAKPYHQAHERGVKLIGAPAHYVTPHLDEGPIIEQEVARGDHTHGPDELMAACQRTARA